MAGALVLAGADPRRPGRTGQGVWWDSPAVGEDLHRRVIRPRTVSAADHCPASSCWQTPVEG